MHFATNRPRQGARGAKVGLFFGSFDPVTLGHLDLVARAFERGLADEIIVLVRRKRAKPHLISRDNARALFELAARELGLGGLTFETSSLPFVRIPRRATFCLRGVRDGLDREYERTVRRNASVGAWLSLRRPSPMIALEASLHLRHVSSTLARAQLEAPTPSATRMAELLPPPLPALLIAARRQAGEQGGRLAHARFNRVLAQEIGDYRTSAGLA